MDVELSSPDKVLWPGVGLTKRDLRDYLVAAAPRILPHLRDRPLSVKRYPRGIAAGGFFQKDLPAHAPDWIERFTQYARSADREVRYAVVDSVDDLRWFAQQNTIEFHPGLVRIDRPDRVDRLVVDVDPGAMGTPVGRIARWVREVAAEVGLDPLVNTSGGRGVHVWVPIERRHAPDRLRAATLALCRLVVERHPDELTVEFRKDDRDGRTLLDWSRTSPGATLVAPWTPRARPGAPVATPLAWEEVDDALDPAGHTIPSVLRRGDPWDVAGRAAALRPQPLGPVFGAIRDLGMPVVDISPRGGRTHEKLARTSGRDE